MPDTTSHKHTPTQWRLNRGSKRFYLTEPVVGGGENQVAEIVTGDEGVARLIAAAPDMYAAALKVMEVAQAEPFSPLWATLYTLREATNKAEGR